MDENDSIVVKGSAIVTGLLRQVQRRNQIIKDQEKRIQHILEIHQNRLDELADVKSELSLALHENKRLQRAYDKLADQWNNSYRQPGSPYDLNGS